MEDAELYQNNNSLQKRDALLCLEEYSTKIKWKQYNNRVIDIGCGDGSVTNLLKKYIPDLLTLLGCDKSEKMVDFAERHHGNDNTSFTVLDIESVLPEALKEKFDHVFSFYALHWIMNQERAFNNIYNLLDDGGNCLMIFIASAPVYDVYRELSRNNKWTSWLLNVDRFISPYHDTREPDKLIRNMMENIGFVDIEVTCKNMVFMYDDIDVMTKALIAVNPFNLPKDIIGEFMADYFEVLKKMQIVDKVNNNFSKSLPFHYRLLVVYGRKPNNRRFVQE